uniref:Uncharacterized protein n=1 Tax=Megaselia scalaris TaxID=36166 RepID=T1H585_MEGSC
MELFKFLIFVILSISLFSKSSSLPGNSLESTTPNSTKIKIQQSFTILSSPCRVGFRPDHNQKCRKIILA